MNLTGPQGGRNHYSFGWFVTIVQDEKRGGGVVRDKKGT